jgi:hypothetical protein
MMIAAIPGMISLRLQQVSLVIRKRLGCIYRIRLKKRRRLLHSFHWKSTGGVMPLAGVWLRSGSAVSDRTFFFAPQIVNHSTL